MTIFISHGRLKRQQWIQPTGDYQRLNTRTIQGCYPLPYIHDIPTNLKRQTVLSKIDILRQCFKKTLTKQLSSFRTDCIHFRTLTVQEILCKTFGDSLMTYLSVLTPCTHISITAQPRSDGESQLQHPDLVLKGHKNIALLKSFSNIRSKPYSTIDVHGIHTLQFKLWTF